MVGSLNPGTSSPSPAFPDGKDATLTIGSTLLQWVGALGGDAAMLAGFLLLAAVLLQARRTKRLEQSRVMGQLRLIPGARNPGPRRTDRGRTRFKCGGPAGRRAMAPLRPPPASSRKRGGGCLFGNFEQEQTGQ